MKNAPSESELDISNTEATRTKVRLVVSSVDVDPDVITTFLEISPSKSWRTGDKVHPAAVNLHKENGWVIIIEADKSESFIEKVIDKIFSLIPSGKLPALRKRYPSVEIELSIVTHIAESAIPSISLNATQVAFLAECGGYLDVDIYLR